MSMGSGEDMGKQNAEAIMSFFMKSFVGGDNLPRDIACERAFIVKEKACLAIRAHLASGELAPFMKSGQRSENRWIFTLKKPIIIESVRGDDKYEFLFKDIELQLGNSPIDIETLRTSFYEKEGWEEIKALYKGIWDDCAKDLPCFNLRVDLETVEYTVNGKGKEEGVPLCIDLRGSTTIFPRSGNRIDVIEITKRAQEELKDRSLFELCRDISPYNTPEKVCRFFGVNWAPYEESKTAFNSMRIDVFQGGSDEKSSENLDSVRIFKSYPGMKVFNFRNASGDVVQKVGQIKSKTTNVKALVPVTTWMRYHRTSNSFFCIPLPKGQMLYNLDLLMENAKSESKKAVILTDSLEIVEANQRLGDHRFIWTSWICDETVEQPFAQVDWAPLKDAGPLYYLISDHSDMTLADAYIKAYNLADYLEDNQEIELKFIQAPVKFSKEDVSLGVESKHVRVIEVFEEFEKMYEDAVKALSSPMPPWYAKATAADSPQAAALPSILERLSKKKEAISYLLRPFITKGEISLLYAWTGMGKSALAYTFSAAVIAGEDPFQEYRESGVAIGDMKWWNAIKVKEGEFRKVLYLDFELGQERIDYHIKNYMLPYLPSGKAESEECLNNFDFRDLSKNIPDYSQPENHGKILKMVEESRKKGNGRLPDMIVMDTYSKAVGGYEDMDTWTRMKPLFDELCSMGMAVLIVHQATKDGKSRGFADKDDNFTGVLHMSRPGNASGTLDVPLQLEAKKLSASCVNIDYDMFEVRFISGEKGNGGKWTVHKPSISSDEEFGVIVSRYKMAGYKRDAIATMMKMGHDTCHRRMQAWRAKYGSKYKSMKLE